MYFMNYMCGKLLGEGCMTKQDRRKPRFQFMHRTEDFGWAYHCYEQLVNDIPVNRPAYRKVVDKRLSKGFSESYVVQSKTDELITSLYKIWYPHGKKRLPKQWIHQHMDERSLAWWYQDDGHLKLVNGVMHKIILSTDSFTVEENEFLKCLLWNKWKLNFRTDAQNRLILYDKFQIHYFLHLISPWLHESMNRKSLVIQPLQPIATRTTIYLPSIYRIKKPTAEINEKLNSLVTLFIDSTTNTVCTNHIFHTFLQLRSEPKDMNNYQIVIREAHRLNLARIRQQTGLTISELVEYCFRKNENL